ncbi:MAG: hypothetical protein AAF235_02425 [Planctomycetota bacterium]
MSRKWQRTKRWDAEHLRGPFLTPVRWVLHALSSIRLAVITLTLVALYGTVASVPIGLLALIPTWLIIIGTAALAGGALAVLAGGIARAVTSTRGRAVRFSATVLCGLAGGVAGGWLWASFAWPVLHYDPASGTGLRLFAGFVEAYDSTTLRRLPGFEMTELEFYSWWPMRALLLLFVLNMFVATVRRIELTFKNLGVLTVHSGIITIALGSVYYQTLKLEGDTILVAGNPPLEAGAEPAPGPAQRVFYDGTRMVLFVSQEGRRTAIGSPLWQQLRIEGLPRYNAYALDAGLPDHERLLSHVATQDTAAAAADTHDHDHSGDAEDRGRTLDIDLPKPTVRGGLDPDIEFSIVGYAPYADLATEQVVTAPGDIAAVPPEVPLNPVRQLELFFTPLGETREDGDQPSFRFTLQPRTPASRLSRTADLAVEMTDGMDTERWRDLQAPNETGAAGLLVIEVPGATRDDGAVPRVVVPSEPGASYEIGDTGWTVAVASVSDDPPFPLITEGYEGATSSVAVLRITPPDEPAYDRWVYHRFPEISQDLLPSEDGTPGGMPSRRDADPAIRVSFVDASRLQIFVDRVEANRWRAIVREPGRGARVFGPFASGEKVLDVIPRIDIAALEGWPHAETVEVPRPVPEADQDGRFVGTHDMAKIAVEVSLPSGGGEPRWSEIIWLPFSRYMGMGDDTLRSVTLPDGREVTLAFGRLQRPFPGFSLRLLNFEMIAYDHRGAPRDFQSRLLVDRPAFTGEAADFQPYESIAKLNAPLRAPYVWEDRRGLISNVGMRLTNGLNPNQFKISQAGWDQAGWNETQELADQGLVPGPRARFTIMQVGNNPGIHVIAFGGVLMAVGIPWAFYVKPWLVRREKARLAATAASRAPVGPRAVEDRDEAVEAGSRGGPRADPDIHPEAGLSLQGSSSAHASR